MDKEKLQRVKTDLKELKKTVHLINTMIRTRNEYLYRIKLLSSLHREKSRAEARALTKALELMNIEEQIERANKTKEKYISAIYALPLTDKAIAIDYFLNGTPAVKIALSLSYSEDGIRKRLPKIINKIAALT